MQYLSGKEKAAELWDKFVKAVRHFECIPECSPLTEEEKRDAFFRKLPW